MSLVIVSDLHIHGADDPVYRALLELIRTRAGDGDTLVLAGDIFDLFVGAKPLFLERYRELLDALRDAGARGARLHYIEGNHDFLIRRAFGGIRGLSVHADGVKLEIAGKRFLVAHGDLADKKDYGYLLLRAFFRSVIMKAFVALSSGELLDWIGRTSSHYSRNRNPLLPSDLPIERRERLRTVFRSYAAERLAQGFDYVVMGHCHDLDEMGFTVSGRPGQYINVGFPRVHGSFLSWSPGDPRIQRESLSIR